MRPKFTGKKLNETLGKWHFWTLFIGFWMTFLVQHWLGVIGMPRRVANYPFLPGYATVLNDISSTGSFVLGASTLFFLYNLYWTWKHGQRVSTDDPWGLPTPWNGRPHALRQGTTSARSRGSAPNDPPSTCTTRISPRAVRAHASEPILNAYFLSCVASISMVWSSWSIFDSAAGR